MQAGMNRVSAVTYLFERRFRQIPIGEVLGLILSFRDNKKNSLELARIMRFIGEPSCFAWELNWNHRSRAEDSSLDGTELTDDLSQNSGFPGCAHPRCADVAECRDCRPATAQLVRQFNQREWF
jgi:hypothetical protein